MLILILTSTQGQARREGGGANCRGLWGPLVIFFVGPQSFFRAKYLCFSGKVPKFGMEKVVESATRAIKTFLGRKFFSWKIRNRGSRNKFAPGPRKALGGPAQVDQYIHLKNLVTPMSKCLIKFTAMCWHYTRKNLTFCSKSAMQQAVNKLCWHCLSQVWNKLLTACNNLVDIIRLVIACKVVPTSPIQSCYNNIVTTLCRQPCNILVLSWLYQNL
jgi:hypothetical protein